MKMINLRDKVRNGYRPVVCRLAGSEGNKTGK